MSEFVCYFVFLCNLGSGLAPADGSVSASTIGRAKATAEVFRFLPFGAGGFFITKSLFFRFW
jgi:hypothetical protein